MNNEFELKPCPFCGSKKYPPRINYDTHWNYYSIVCGYCGVEGENIYLRESKNALEEAIEAWNRRA
jgi:Lar family restriction alleviation protein